MAYLLDPGEGKYLLEDLALRYLSLELTSPDQVEGTLDFDGEANARETGRRVAVLVRLADALARGARRARARRAVREHRAAARPGAREDGRRPACASTSAFLEDLGKELGDECRRLEAEIHAHAGEQFNVNSTPQLRRILFDQLGLVPVKKTKTGRVDRRRLAAEARRTSTRSSRRCCATARSRSSGAPTPTRCRRSCRPTVASTPPSTSSRPRPGASRARRRTCRTFRCARRPGASCARRSSPTTAAACSPPTTRRSSCACSRTSPRTRASSRRSSAAPTCTPPPRRPSSTSTRRTVDEFQRRFAKVVNYGLAYGMEAYGLGTRLDIPTDQAREILDAYFAAFPNIAAYMTETIREAKSTGLHHHAVRPAPPAARAVVATTSASARWASAWRRTRRCRGARPTSSSSPWSTSTARSPRAVSRAGWCSPCTTSSCSRCRSASATKVTEVVRETMEQVTELRVPLVVDIGFGATWADAKK